MQEDQRVEYFCSIYFFSDFLSTLVRSLYVTGDRTITVCERIILKSIQKEWDRITL